MVYELVSVDVGCRQGDGDGSVFVCGNGFVLRDGCVVYGVDGDVDVGVSSELSVGYGYGNLVAAAVVCVGRVGDFVSADGRASVCRCAGDDVSELVSVDVGCRQGDGDGCVFVCGNGFVLRDGCVVYGVDGDVDVGVGSELSVGYGNGDLVAAAVVCVRRVGDFVSADDRASVCGCAGDGVGELVSVDVGGRQGDGDGSVFVCGNGFVLRNGCVVYGVDGDIDVGVSSELSVGYRYGDLVAAVVVGVGRVGNFVAGDGRVSVCRCAGDGV